MKLWGGVFGALLGWALADFETYGAVIGAVLGFVAGLWLESAVRALATTTLKRIVDLELKDYIARQIELAFEGRSPTPTQPTRAIPATRQDDPVQTAPAQPFPDTPWPEPSAAPAPREPAEPAEPTLAERGFAAVRDWFLGGNTIVRVGLVILFVGLSFLARLAVNAGLFPIEVRLAMVGAAGAALLGVGFNRRIARPQFGRALQGAGVAVLYLTVFASARVFEVMPLLAAFGLMIVFCALGVALALLQNSRTMALASFAGGFAVPLLLGGKSPTPLPLFAYYTILNLAILFIAWRRAWRSLNLLGFAATFGMATLWGLTSYEPQHYLLCQAFLAATVLIYLATAVLYAHNTPGKLGNTADATLLFGPAIAGFGLEAGLVQDRPFASAFAALAFGAVYVAAAFYTARDRREGMRTVHECLIAIGVGFVTMAIPLALEVKWTSAAWALEGAGAFWVGARQARWMPRAFGLLLIAVAAAICVNQLRLPISAVPLANTGFIGALMVAVPLLLLAWWLRAAPLAHSGSRLAGLWAPIETGLAKPAFLAGFGFICIAIGLEIGRQITMPDGMIEPAIAYPLQPLAAMLAVLAAMAVAQWFGRRGDWTVATWPARLSLPLLALGLLYSVADGRHVLEWPDVVFWLPALALHGLMLRAEARTDRWARLTHAGTVWLLTGMVADSLDLAIDRAALWDTSWSGVTFLVAGIAVLMVLTRWAGRAVTEGEGLDWPLDRYARAYWWTAALPLAVLVYLGAFTTALYAAGVTDPLPYIPLLNPVDLSVALALAALLLRRRMLQRASDLPPVGRAITGNEGMVALAALAFAGVNGAWLRTAHHFLGVAYDQASLGASPVVQTGLAIIWTLLAMGLMLLAARRGLRAIWIAGAALLGLVVLKLLFVDMSSAEGWQRIVTFIGVGVLMLVIGYFVPLPPRKTEAGGAAA